MCFKELKGVQISPNQILFCFVGFGVLLAFRLELPRILLEEDLLNSLSELACLQARCCFAGGPLAPLDAPEVSAGDEALLRKTPPERVPALNLRIPVQTQIVDM